MTVPQRRQVADFVATMRRAGFDDATINDMANVWLRAGLTELRVGALTLLLPKPPQEKAEHE